MSVKYVFPNVKLGRLENLILKKIQEITQKNPKNPIIDYDILALEVAKEYGQKLNTNSNEIDDPIKTKSSLNPEYIKIFHSYKKALNFRASFYKSLKRLEKNGIVKIQKEIIKGKRSRKSHVIMLHEI